MQKTDWKYFVDVLLFVAIFGIVVIGLLLGFVIPRGPSAPEENRYFLGLHRHDWGDIHFYIAIAFCLVLVVHLILEWNWIKGKPRQVARGRWPFLVGAVPAGGFLVLLFAWGVFQAAGDRYVDYRPALMRAGIPEVSGSLIPEHDTGIDISGQMTLREIERRTGVPAMDIAAGLGLPGNISFDETVGRLRRTYGFEMHDVRDVVTRALARQKR
jgi:hypothetical protein